MAYFLLLCISSLISICTSDIPVKMNGQIYNQKKYNPIGSSLAQLIIKNKLLCAAQCAHQFPTCNTAVYDSSVVPQCLLFSEPLTEANLIDSNNAVVYDFQQSKFRGMKSTKI